MSDTPTNRATINQLTIEHLDQMLESIRERRLIRVKKLEEIARVKADEARLIDYIKFEKEYKRIQRMMIKLEHDEAKVEQAMHKLRLLAMSFDEAA